MEFQPTREKVGKERTVGQSTLQTPAPSPACAAAEGAGSTGSEMKWRGVTAQESGKPCHFLRAEVLEGVSRVRSRRCPVVLQTRRHIQRRMPGI